MERKEMVLAQLSKADTEELVQMLAEPSLEDQEILRAYLGPKCFQRLRGLALRRQLIRRELGDETLGNVIVVPSLLANELSFEQHGRRERIWLNAKAVASGQLIHMRLAHNGRFDAGPDMQLQASGLMKRYYGELLLTLAQRWNTCAFWYDWRKSLELAATQLRSRIDNCFGDTGPVHIIGVGEGGIVARLYIAQHAKHWQEHGGRLLLLGTPNSGAVDFVQALAGHLDIAWWADLLDDSHSRTDFIDIIRSFPSIYQLLPSPDLDPRMIELYSAETYGICTGIRKSYLEDALEIQKSLKREVDPERTICIVGYNQPTFDGINMDAFKEAVGKWTPERDLQDLVSSLYHLGSGDGDVSVASATLKNSTGNEIPTYFVDVAGDRLLTSPTVLHSLDDLLTISLQDNAWRHIKPDLGLEIEMPQARMFQQNQSRENSKQIKQEEWQKMRSTLRAIVRNLSSRGGGKEQAAGSAEHERTIEDSLLRNLQLSHMVGQPHVVSRASFKPPRIAVDVKLGDITDLNKLRPEGPPIDAIVVGNYLGELPQGAFKHLDVSVSAALQNKENHGQVKELTPSELTFSQLIQRGVIRSELASFFFLADPRKLKGPQRTIIVAGTGVPGRFGAPELKIMVRELCWTVCRLGMKHLATVLIGAGRSNLSISDATEAWLRGIKDAATGLDTGDAPAIHVTFIELDSRKVLELDEAICQQKAILEKEQRMSIDYTPLTDKEFAKLSAQAVSQIEERAKRHIEKMRKRIEALQKRKNQDAPATVILTTRENLDEQVVRIAVRLEGSTYRFGAITDIASIPERDVPLDTRLVAKANNELAASDAPELQAQSGEVMARLLLPEDFRANLSGGAPVILTLDSTTARIHWELLRPPHELEQDVVDVSDLDRFLCIGCGLTRQLRSTLAPRPEPVPPPKRLLRVLVIADPAADNRLPGAEEEGHAVADLFEHFNYFNQIAGTGNRIEVVRLIGPSEATRTSVLRELLTRSYDVLHFAGHCVYEEENPVASGWIFTDNERLTANEIRRIDRVPAFVFSNACESGVTPDRSGSRSDALAPTFAETFFARGVSNFVCTAWPVADRAARDFALALYAQLLGLEYTGKGLRIDRQSYKLVAPRPMYIAMRCARLAIAEPGMDGRTWGAYQHYGSPYSRLFAETSN